MPGVLPGEPDGASSALQQGLQAVPPTALPALCDLLLQLADDDLVLGHRDSEWLGLAPDLEPDVAMASIAQDEVGHACAYYGILEELGAGAKDMLAFGRPPERFRNALLVERPNGSGTYLDQPGFDWAFAVVRQYLYDLFEQVRLEALANSAFLPLARLARKVQVEERYHLVYGQTWLSRLAAGPEEARSRVVSALEAALAWTADLCSLGEHEHELVERRLISAGSAELTRRWLSRVDRALSEAGLADALPCLQRGGTPDWEARKPGAFDGRRGRHSPALAELLDVMTEVIRTEPGAAW